MKVEEYVLKCIELDKELYGKMPRRDGIIYKELSDRFPNGKKILCEIKVFLEEFGDIEMDDENGRRFRFLKTRYEIIRPTNYEKEKKKMIEESSIIVEKNYAIEMRAYKRELEKGCLLRSPFENDYREW